MKKFYKSPYNLYLTILVAVNALPFLAPILLKLSESGGLLQLPARAIYFVYSFTCHQFHHRSIHLYDNQVAWCSRDMGIWMGVLVAAVGVRYLGMKKIRWFWLIPFTIPIALDGGIQTIATMLEIAPGAYSGDPIYISSNLVRFATGAIFGLGLSLFISGNLMEGSSAQSRLQDKLPVFRDKIRTIINSQVKQILLVVGVMLVSYVSLVGAWALTSIEYKPTDMFDSAVKTPATGFYIRRANGVCPTTEGDLFNWSCFFN